MAIKMHINLIITNKKISFSILKNYIIERY